MRNNEASSEEQKICISCGFCCDRTIFLYARLNPGERGNLPDLIERNSFTESGKDYFRLPCPYFSGKCSIYDQKRADVCSAFRCQLLRDFKEGRFTMEEAGRIVSEGILIRRGILDDYHRITGNSKITTFKKVLSELGNIWNSTEESLKSDFEYEMLQAKCNIFEALLIKYFRPSADFDKLVMK